MFSLISLSLPHKAGQDSWFASEVSRLRGMIESPHVGGAKKTTLMMRANVIAALEQLRLKAIDTVHQI